MTDAEYAAQKKRLVRLKDRWYAALGLGWWRIEETYYREGGEGFAPPEGSSWGSLATCVADWSHKAASISWNMPAVAETDDYVLETAYVHEMMHLFVSEMREGVVADFNQLPHEERVCTQLAEAFLWTRTAGSKDKK